MNKLMGAMEGCKPLLLSVFLFLGLTACGLYWYAANDSGSMLALSLVTALLAGAMLYTYLSGRVHFETDLLRVFGAILSLSCAVFAFAFPPFSVPDEFHHFCSSYWMSGFFTGDSDISDSSVFLMRDEDYELYDFFSKNAGDMLRIGISDFAAIEEASSFPMSHEGGKHEVRGYEFTVGSENAFAKIGSVAGVLIARLFGMNGLGVFYFGRLFAALQFVITILASVRLMPFMFGKLAIVGTSLLPMSLHLASSFSYDSGIISLTILLISYLLHLMHSEGLIGMRSMLLLALISAVVAPLKVVYASVLLLVLCIPSSKFSSKKMAFVSKLAVFTAAALSLFVMRASSVGAMASASSGLDYRGAEAGHFYELGYFLAHPLHLFKLLFASFDHFADYYLFTMLGGSLGWLQQDLEAPKFFILIYAVLILIALQPNAYESNCLPVWQRVLFCAIFLIVVLGVMMSMCLGWTFDTEQLILGVQGRYFLPVLPLMLMAFRSQRVHVSLTRPVTLVIVGFSILNMVYITRILSVAITLP